MDYIKLFAAGTPLTCKIIILLVQAIAGAVAGLVLIGFVVGIIHYRMEFKKIRKNLAKESYYYNIITNLNERP